MDITENPEYKASVKALDEAIRAHHALLERIGNEEDVNEDGTTDSSLVSGWVLVIGTTGFNSGDGEFHDAMVEVPDHLNNFTGWGLAKYGERFMENLCDNWSV